MSFRKLKGVGNQSQSEWDAWLVQNQNQLLRAGLPKAIYKSPSHWRDFLENGELHWHREDCDGFYVLDLSKAQMIELTNLLEHENIVEPESYNLLNWLRVNTGSCSDSSDA